MLCHRSFYQGVVFTQNGEEVLFFQGEVWLNVMMEIPVCIALDPVQVYLLPKTHSYFPAEEQTVVMIMTQGLQGFVSFQGHV